MLAQKIVSAEHIESELFTMWETLAEKKTNRAGLFNLVVYAEKTPHLCSIREIVQDLIEKFPCRVFFITYDKKARDAYLKTAISVISLEDNARGVACDSIDIGVGKDAIKMLPYLLLTHLLPDLPTHLFWTENPHNNTPLLKSLASLTDRIIFDSHTFESLFAFATYVQGNLSYKKIDLIDIRWIATNYTQEVLTSLFYSPEKWAQLSTLTHVFLTYNAPDGLSYQITASYIIFWLASLLDWSIEKCQKFPDKKIYTFNKKEKKIQVTMAYKNEPKLLLGEIITMQFHTKKKEEIDCMRTSESLENMRINEKNPQSCSIGKNIHLNTFSIGHILAQEIVKNGTCQHFLGTLHKLSCKDL